MIVRGAELDFQELQSRIKDAAESAFREVRSRYPNEEFCGYGLYSDPDAITVCPAVNACAHLEKVIADDPDDEEYYRWSPGEWNHEFEGAGYFREISSSLANEVKGIKSPEEHRRFKQQLYECCVTVLEDIKRDRFFSDMGESGVLVFTVSDAENESECDWIDCLNRMVLAVRFRNWFGASSV